MAACGLLNRILADALSAIFLFGFVLFTVLGL